MNKTRGGFAIPEPYSPAASACALYRTTGAGANSCLSSCVTSPGVLYGSDVISPGALGPASIARVGNMGGLNPGVDLGVYYDPTSKSMRAPVTALSGDGGTGAVVITAPSMANGPSAFLAYGMVDSDLRPGTQFAPQGDIAVEQLVWDVYDGPCGCGGCIATECRPAFAFAQSLASLLVTGVSAQRVRAGLQAAGVVFVTPRLAAVGVDATDDACACRVMGGPSNYAGLVKFAMRYQDTSIVQLLDVQREIRFLLDVYVQEVLTDVRSQVIATARANYVRAEGPRAGLQPRLAFTDVDDDAYDDAAMSRLPEVLPGTQVRVSLQDSAFAARALLDPRACYRNRLRAICETGLPIGETPSLVPDLLQTTQACPDARCLPTPPFQSVGVPVTAFQL